MDNKFNGWISSSTEVNENDVWKILLTRGFRRSECFCSTFDWYQDGMKRDSHSPTYDLLGSQPRTRQ